MSSRAFSARQQLSKRWHAEPPPVLKSACLVVDKANGRTFIIGYDSKEVLTFNFISSTEACDSTKEEKQKGEHADSDEEWQDKGDEGFDWQHAQWTSLPYPGGAAHHGRRFDTEYCFLSSDHKFMVPSYEGDGEGGFSVWDHDQRTWTHVRLDKECSCHEESFEKGNKIKVKADAKQIKFDYPNQMAVVYQSYRKEAPAHDNFSAGSEEAIDTVVIHWKDANDRDHLTGIQLVNHQVYSCHDIKVARETLPSNLTLIAAPVNPNHYTFHKNPKKYKHEGDHGSRCENTTLFLFGPHGSGWFDISIADRPSPRPVDILYHEHKGHEEKGGFHPLPNFEGEHPRTVYYGGQLWIFGKNPKGVGVWSIDTAESDHGYEIVPQSQGGPTPGSLACASCGDGIIVYGGCDRSEDCSTNLAPGEEGKLGGSAPVSIYRPGIRNGEDDDDDDDEDEDDNEEDNEEGESGENGEGHEGHEGHEGGEGSGHEGGEGGSGGSGESGGSTGSGGSSGSGSGESGSGGAGGSSGSGSGGSGSGGSGSGSGGSGSGGAGGSGSSGSGGSGSGGSGS
ncbi:hypothetical protein BGZ97_005465, partial [Linnemannia gamsii]